MRAVSVAGFSKLETITMPAVIGRFLQRMAAADIPVLIDGSTIRHSSEEIYSPKFIYENNGQAHIIRFGAVSREGKQLLTLTIDGEKLSGVEVKDVRNIEKTARALFAMIPNFPEARLSAMR